VAQASKEQQSRDRMREYAARVEAARAPVAVLARFAQAREARGTGDALEVEFAATPAGVDGASLPAAVWVVLRQGDVDAVTDLIIEHATEQFLIAEHEQLDASYRITTVAESLALPDVERLTTQVAAFIDVPRDVVAIVCDWGPDDPRTEAEIERLIEQRYATGAPPPAVAHSTAALVMSSSEFAAVLSLTAEQAAILATLVRQADITVTAD
jgi:hypothetical protein